MTTKTDLQKAAEAYAESTVPFGGKRIDLGVFGPPILQAFKYGAEHLLKVAEEVFDRCDKQGIFLSSADFLDYLRQYCGRAE